MRILRIIDTLDPTAGGTVEALRVSTEALLKRGHEIEVLCLDEPDARFLGSYGFPVHAVGRFIRKYGYTPRLSAWLTANAARFDVGIIEGLWTHATTGGGFAMAKAGLPYVVFTHGMMDPWFRRAYPLKHVAKQIFWWLFLGRVLRKAETVLFTCEEEKRLARGVFHGPPYAERVVAFGTSDAPPANPAQNEAFRNAIPALESRPFLLFLSRIHPKKGCDLLIESFARIAAGHPELNLVIAGPDQVGLVGDFREQATKAGVGDRVHFPGMLQGDVKWGAFRSAQAFILPSHQENFGIVVAEAMAAGTPVLITDKVNIWREVEESGGGLVASDTLDGTNDLLKRFLAMSEDQRKLMGTKARAGYEHHFSVEGAASDLLDVLQRTSEARQTRRMQVEAG